MPYHYIKVLFAICIVVDDGTSHRILILCFPWSCILPLTRTSVTAEHWLIRVWFYWDQWRFILWGTGQKQWHGGLSWVAQMFETLPIMAQVSQFRVYSCNKLTSLHIDYAHGSLGSALCVWKLTNIHLHANRRLKINRLILIKSLSSVDTKG